MDVDDLEDKISDLENEIQCLEHNKDKEISQLREEIVSYQIEKEK